MQTFTFLKYWTGPRPASASNPTSSAAAAVLSAGVENRAESHGEKEEDGPFFDLEFSVSAEDERQKQGRSEIDDDDDDDDEEEEEDGDSDDETEFNFTLSSGSTNEHSDANLTFSPSSDDLFFKGKFVPVQASSNGGGSSDQPNSKPQLRVTLLKSAAKFRVFMSGFKKSKSNEEKKTEKDGSDDGEQSETESPENPPENIVKQSKAENPPEINENPLEKNENPPKKTDNQTRNKFFAVKFKVEEVPIMSLFTRDNSSKNNKQQKQSSEESASEENRISKELIMQKYLKMVKPLYIRVSRRYGQLILGAAGAKPGEPPSLAAPPTPPAAEAVEVEAPTTTTVNTKGLNMPAKLRVVCKHLGKSRSASAVIAAAPPGKPPSRKNDSLMQEEDGIQSAILHCKRSFNSSREKTADSESSLLSRLVSDTQREKPSDLTEKAID